MEPESLTYAEVADRLGIHPEAARSRAKRSGWRRQAGAMARRASWSPLSRDRPEAARWPPGQPGPRSGKRSHNQRLIGSR